MLATLYTELAIYDIKDPQNPLLLYTISLPENANSVKISGNMLYVSCGDSGIRFYTLGNSSATLAGYFESGNRTSDVLPLTTSLFFVSEETGGVYLLSGTFTKLYNIRENTYGEDGPVTLRKNIGNTLEFTINHEGKSVYYLLDITGRVVHTGTVYGKGSVRLRGLKPGIYYILVNAEMRKDIRKVLIR